MDPTQDLFVVLEDNESRLHIRSISVNETHPLAARGTLEFEDGVVFRSAGLQVALNVIGLFVGSEGILSQGDIAFTDARLLIWNWKTGVLIYDSRYAGKTLGTHVSSFCFLDGGSYVLASEDQQGALCLYSFDPSSPSLSTPTLCAVLCLPSIEMSFTLTLHPSPISAGHPETSTFYSPPESHMMILSACYLVAPSLGPSTNYNLFVHKRTLLNYINRFHHQESAGKSGPLPNMNMDWKSWGEMNTRFMKVPSNKR
ncbi:hypothetical protein CPB84DRAFT_1799096 [Gymnopilus junonius]|uniref:Uncharacterized protein n=1 Tax=Gymnopilus junonius TaxID=109634 RepID=A0A9P5N9D1_GYMJU|nr:hypothetical protein CPB84DRAFT_1799096 [Gymnopilus junonius]